MMTLQPASPQSRMCECKSCVLGGDTSIKPCEFREDTGIEPAWLCDECYDDAKNQPEPQER